MNLMTWWRRQPVMTVKACARCRLVQPLTEYPRWGRSPYCTLCRAALDAEWRATNHCARCAERVKGR